MSIIAIEHLTQRLANSSITDDPTEYPKAFWEIVKLAHSLRGRLRSPIADDEIRVTKELAGPFTTGGLMVLLLEPLQSHSWSEGTAVVIERCKTLKSLQDGLRITSNGYSELSLMHNVSLLDLRPFICREQKLSLSDEEIEALYDAVFEAVCAKRPKVLLCMGREPKYALAQRRELSGTQIVHSLHPSYYINHDPTVENYAELLLNMSKAYSELTGQCLDRTMKRLQSYIACVPVTAIGHVLDARCIETFLQMFLKICLGPRHILPRVRAEQGGYYKFKKWHLRYFSFHTDGSKTNESVENTARTGLIPILMAMNNCVQQVGFESSFIPIYQINWKVLCAVFSKESQDLERLFEVLALEGGSIPDSNSVILRIDHSKIRSEILRSQIYDLLGRMEHILRRVSEIQENMRFMKRDAEHVIFVD